MPYNNIGDSIHYSTDTLPCQIFEAYLKKRIRFTYPKLFQESEAADDHRLLGLSLADGNEADDLHYP